MTKGQRVVLGQCDASNPSYQWTWMAGDRLVHVQSSRCLWADPSLNLPSHTRLVKLSECSKAPGWSCYSTEGAFGLAETHMHLRKMGSRVMVAENLQTGLQWRKYNVDSGGNQLITSLCHNTGEFRMNHQPIQFPFIRCYQDLRCWLIGSSPPPSGLNKLLSPTGPSLIWLQ